MGPAMVIVEKSLDGEWWSRSTEVADMKEWGDKMETYPLITMNHGVAPVVARCVALELLCVSVPTSIFAFRSQDNPRFCVGVRPTPHPTDEKVLRKHRDCQLMSAIRRTPSHWLKMLFLKFRSAMTTQIHNTLLLMKCLDQCLRMRPTRSPAQRHAHRIC